MQTIRQFLTIAALLLVTGASAAEDYWPPTSLPPEQSQGDVQFLTGGIGSDESAEIRKVAPTWPLVLVFTQAHHRHAGWLADVGVRIRNQHGEMVLETTSDGPYLLARLPPGRYAVEARSGDVTKKRTVTVPDHGSRRVIFEWAPPPPANPN
ncbi:MAG: carboxypeptidase regulatory-like domain-containing protein [Betaproteobacteria bacterium]|nr:carboxypeptidase regulatory-like domain-containing protein [Betaproteobacteria bacterium]